MTYADLAKHAGCTIRSVRNYLQHAEDIFGFPVERVRGKQHSIYVVAASKPVQPPASQPNWQDLAETAFVQIVSSSASASTLLLDNAPVVVACRGLPQYSHHQRSAVGHWISATKLQPRKPIRLQLASTSGEDQEVQAWPVGVIMHNVDGIVLVMVPIDADAALEVRAICLAALSDSPDAVTVLASNDAVPVPARLESFDWAAHFDLPFCTRPRPQDRKAQAMVRVRFSSKLATQVQNRVWHASQHTVLRKDGSTDVSFGPVDLGAAASWVSSWGKAVEVLGDKRLRKTIKKRNFVP